eukprot:CAMPEP_0175171896 /NCGR_PEP_ID=MMETSP0087-20121206/31107_1 /TAXON_ID=136419 /ORGANISM="Unknown Unknown, Strain D1" /LENGTH=32 /DNA_ID= /DNA_START= /DNA_END= /DNA_ORIENTATION=
MPAKKTVGKEVVVDPEACAGIAEVLYQHPRFS